MQYLPAFIFTQLSTAKIVGATVFHTNCTIPPEGSNYVSGPNVRSTLSILWSSLSTIFLCTWTVQHVSLPGPPHGGSWVRMVRAFWRKVKWTLIMAVAPEFTVGKALGDCFAAFRSTKCSIMQDHARASGIKWTMTHAFYANMGGFVVRPREAVPDHRCYCACTDSIDSLQDAPRAVDPDNKGILTTTQVDPTDENHLPWWKWWKMCKRWKTFLVSPRHLYEEEPPQSWKREGNVEFSYCYDADQRSFRFEFAANSAQLCMLLSKKVIRQLPSISEDEINDKSKEDMVVKLFTLFQVLWLIIQLILRQARGLQSAQLEIAAASFAVCTAITYLLWLKKPKDILKATDVFATWPLNGHTEDTHEHQLIKEQLIWLNSFGFFENSLQGLGYRVPELTIPNDLYSIEAELHCNKDFAWVICCEDIGFSIGGIIFGACHCLAWNFVFPSTVEQTLWRVCSVFTSTAVPFYYLVWCVMSQSRHKLLNKTLCIAFLRVMSLLYVLGRLYLLIEVFRSLCYLPSDAYVATWSQTIPHIR